MTGLPEKKILFIPTYNEKDNIERLYRRICELNLPLDFLLLDDNSPDGTGAIMDRLAKENPKVSVIHRSGKLGIGSAHKDGIRWAYEHGYQTLVTMDADFTHSPDSIPSLLKKADNADIVTTSRHLSENSLEGWNLLRKCLTKCGYWLTRFVLRMPYDATGAFRLYRLDRIPVAFLEEVESNGYSFFFESLYILHRKGFRIAEVPIALPPRTYGSSKMDYSEIARSLKQLWALWMRPVKRAPLSPQFKERTWKTQ